MRATALASASASAARIACNNCTYGSRPFGLRCFIGLLLRITDPGDPSVQGARCLTLFDGVSNQFLGRKVQPGPEFLPMEGDECIQLEPRGLRFLGQGRVLI